MQNSYAEELVKEQAYFDDARLVYENAVSERQRLRNVAGTGPDRRAMKRHLDSVEKLSENDAVAIGRMDLDDGSSIYVGKVSIAAEDGERRVISWKAPLAKKFYQASATDAMDLTRKRVFSTSYNHVDAFDDKLFAEIRERLDELGGDFHTDDALLHALQEGRTGQMLDIVRTIQASQDKLMRADMNQLLVIQGGPGTGKTAVALHRASWLLYHYRDKLSPRDLLVVGPNPAFTKYIQHVLPSLGDRDIRQTSIQELMAGSLPARAVDNEATARIKGMAEMADVIANGLNDRIKVPSSVLRIKRRNSSVTVNISPEMIADDVNSLRHLPYGKGRQELRERLLERCLEQLNFHGSVDIKDILDPPSVDAALDRMWPTLSGPQFIRELLGSKSRLRIATANVLDPSAIELLYRQAAARMDQEPWTLGDLALIDEANESMSGNVDLYGHIIVDEAQDLSPMQLLSLRRRTRTGSMTIVGDVAQSTGSFARADWSEVITALGTSLPHNLVSLEHGYRVPREVFEVAAKLLPLAAPGLKPPTIVRSANALPELFDVPEGQLASEVAKVASHHSGKGRFVGVIAPKERWDEIKTAFQHEELTYSDSSDGQLGKSINLITPNDSKGLEFDSVVIVDPQSILDEDNGARLLYIALTRTTHRLDVLCTSGNIPGIIADAFEKITVIDNPVENTQNTDTDSVDEGTKAKEPVDDEPYGRSASMTPTPAILAGKKTSPPTLLQSASESHAQKESPQKMYKPVEQPISLSPIEQELVRRNAEFLNETVLKFYGSNVQVAILQEALNLCSKVSHMTDS
ncbi:HelD family protein [Glutamicibacter protophormiae]|uniref:DNA helicase IV n=1 Tax=Glutamicibacter protophormiae TaxID=37930 RepID=A0ABS4XVN4_GLUPR|nr:AAA family ATPase [Glutamicibacter protophormiae]MBP2399763.1 DNA helicase IV [Glutamicibacter protophormiae]GGL89024.1 hypothetical protein GCM10010038_18740 [Glutamicibacter protophormiae]